MPQAYYNAREGIRCLGTETGAGQWGTALSFACAQYDLECAVYMVCRSFEQKLYCKVIMEMSEGPGSVTHGCPFRRPRPRSTD